MLRPPPRPPLFPYTTLFRSCSLLRLEEHRRATFQKRSPAFPRVNLTDPLLKVALGVCSPVRQYGTAVDKSVDERWFRRLPRTRSEEHTSELQSQSNLVCRLL